MRRNIAAVTKLQRSMKSVILVFDLPNVERALYYGGSKASTVSPRHRPSRVCGVERAQADRDKLARFFYRELHGLHYHISVFALTHTCKQRESQCVNRLAAGAIACFLSMTLIAVCQ